MVRPSLKKMGGVEHTASIVRTRKISTYLQSLPKIPPKEMHQAKHTPQFSPSGTQKEEKDRFSPRIYLHQLQCHSEVNGNALIQKMKSKNKKWIVSPIYSSYIHMLCIIVCTIWYVRVHPIP